MKYRTESDRRSVVYAVSPNAKCRVKASEAPLCDINSIVAKARVSGRLPDMIKADPVYGDFTKAGDFQRAMNVVLRAREQFAALDARTRDRFANDPARFLEFASDPGNIDELRELGLCKPVPPEPVTRGAAPPLSPSTVEHPAPDLKGVKTPERGASKKGSGEA